MADAKKTLYTKHDLAKARFAMLKELASISGGELIRGCCTQGCCELEAQSFATAFTPSEISHFDPNHSPKP